MCESPYTERSREERFSLKRREQHTANNSLISFELSSVQLSLAWGRAVAFSHYFLSERKKKSWNQVEQNNWAPSLWSDFQIRFEICWNWKTEDNQVLKTDFCVSHHLVDIFSPIQSRFAVASKFQTGCFGSVRLATFENENLPGWATLGGVPNIELKENILKWARQIKFFFREIKTFTSKLL